MTIKKKPRAAKATRSKKTAKRAPGTKREPRPKIAAPAQQGPESARLQAQLRQAIEREIVARIEAHQHDVAQLRARMAAEAPKPLMLLAHGDSWFDYPCDGNTYTPFSTSDIIAHLRNMGSPKPKILNISHHGDATTDEMGLAKQQRLIKVLGDRNNWLNDKPDAILFSGGGNDIAGDPFCIYLDYKGSSSSGLDAERFTGRLASIRASYQDLFVFRDRYAPGVPIFGHGYDNAHPMEPHPPCAGPWIKPGLRLTGWSDEEGRTILLDVLTQFRKMLGDLEGDPRKFDFTVVHTEGALAEKDWANELHPIPKGFKRLAERFLAPLRARFPGRI